MKKSIQILAFIGTVLGFFMALLDTTIVNIAIPDMINVFNANVTDVSWIINGYNLTFAIFLLTASRIADKYGRKKIFILGIGIFVGASILCGVSESLNQLIIFRFIQGLGAAITVPVSIPIALELFSDNNKSKVVGIWGALSALASASGPVLGGLLIHYLGWEYIFFVNVPLGLISIFLVSIYIEESYGDNKNISLDILGTIFFTIFISSLTYSLIKGDDYGWTSYTILILLVFSIVFLIMFLIRQLKAHNAMLPMKIFKNRQFSLGNITILLIGIILNSILFIFSLYLTKLVGFSTLKAGLILSTLAIATMIISALTGPIVQKKGSLILSLIGLLILISTSFSMFLLEYNSSLSKIILLLILSGIGIGLCFAPVMSSVVEKGGKHYLGVVSGLSNVGRTLGGIMGIAVMVSILNTSIDTSVDKSIKEIKKHVTSNEKLNIEMKKSVTKKVEKADLNKNLGDSKNEFNNKINKKLSTLNKNSFQYEALEKQKKEVIKEINNAEHIFKTNYMNAFYNTFIAIGIFSVIAFIMALFSDSRKRKHSQ